MLDLNVITNLVANVGGKYREATLEGRPHIVCDAVMLTEGVHEGSGGPILYEQQVMNEDPGAWDHMPVVVNHPKKSDGKPSKAREIRVLNTQKIGILLNTKCVDGKLRTECWFDKNRLQTLEPKLFDRIKKGEKVEVSTGLRIDMERSEGEWKGEKYIGKAKKFYPDHLAVLPNSVGACGIADGAGLFANEAILPLVINDASLSSIYSQIRQLLHAAYDEPGYIWMGYIEDVFPEGYFIYSMDSKLYRQDYKVEKDIVSLDGEPQESVRVTQYRLVTDNEYIGNCTGLFISNAEKQNMDKNKIVDTIVANSKGAYKDADKPYLLTQSEERLTELNTIYNTAPTPPVVPPTPPAPQQTPPPGVPNFGTVIEQPKVSMTDVLKNSDPVFNEQWEEGQIALNEQKTVLINIITENGKNTVYTQDELKNMKLTQLRKLAAITGRTVPAPTGPVDYGAIGGGSGSKQPIENKGPEPRLLGTPSSVSQEKSNEQKEAAGKK